MARSCVSSKELPEGGPEVLYAGLDLSRKRLDFELLAGSGERVFAGAVPPDADGLRGLAVRVGGFGSRCWRRWSR